jgi:PKD repeat protein
MMTTKNKIVVLIVFLLSHLSIYAQYNGGNADGSASEQLNTTSCPTPLHFYAYFGGVSDGTSTETLLTTTCGTPNHFYAYYGGSGDGYSSEAFTQTSCGTPNHFYAYFGGINDGYSSETVSNTICGIPPHFYAYFGGSGDGYSLDKTAPICPTQPPVADFTASATEICVGQSVTFTDTSTNVPGAWTWTLPGGTPNSSTAQNPTVVYNTAGTYTVTLLAANFNGNNTKSVTNMITVTAYPTVTGTIPASRCDAGTVSLAATGSAGTLNWYADATGGSPLGTGTSFTTPSISATTTYYVEAVNAGCTSARTAVVATVTATPTIASTTPASRCDAGSVTLNATASAGSTIWYANPSGGSALATTNSFVTPSINGTTTYYVEAAVSGCISPRTAVIATVNTTPVITSTTPATRCDVGTVTLGAIATSGTLNWYSVPTGGSILGTGTSFTTPILSGNQLFYVEASTGTCTSSRTSVLATMNVMPTIAGTAGSRCDTGTVTLSASANIGAITWYANATGGVAIGTGTTFVTPGISNTTTYYAESVNGTCISARIPVIATVNTSPTITSTTPATICGGDTFIISAAASAGTLAWYNVVSGGLVQGTGNTYSLSNLPSSFTFYVQATDGPCQSARIPVAVTVNQTPTNLTAVGASRCGTGTLALSATYTNGIINWYDAASGGNLVFTGSNFVTPSLSGTTTYYVEGVNGTCVSSVRTPITATINAIPSVTSTTPASRCGTGSVTLNASSSVGTLVWYSVNTGGTALGTGTTFNTPSIAGSTTYYVEATNGTCTSTRTAVIATIDIAQTITSTTPASRCDAGTLTLSAAATGGTLNWYAASTGGPVLASGPNFTTPSLSSSMTYYVEVTNGTCTSARLAVVASITPVAAPVGNVNQQFCAGETVGLLVITSGSNIVWHDSATGGTVVPNGTPLISGTIYYASQNNGTCESPTRLAVTATLGTCLGIDEVVFSQMKLYPNPVTDMLTISNTEIMSKVIVADMLGRILSTSAINDIETGVDMSNYPTGTYLVQVSVDNAVKTFKVIKR